MPQTTQQKINFARNQMGLIGCHEDEIIEYQTQIARIDIEKRGIRSKIKTLWTLQIY